MTNRSGELVFSKNLPGLDERNTVLIYDRVLENKYRSWIHRFPLRYKVRSGEKLKDLHGFPKHVEALASLCAKANPKSLAVVAFGGGSIGDFAGFFASVYRRGVPLIHLPSTWLSALDSAHGGKTALNLKSVKNQIGSFYPAVRIHLVRSVLLELPEDLAVDAGSEALKVALIDSKALYQKVQKIRGSKELWLLLPELIEAKLKIVRKDPFEKRGPRRLLNLGHTMGHVFEVGLGVSHGRAIALGLRFVVDWSKHLGLLRTDVTGFGLASSIEAQQALQKLKRIEPLLRADKKRVLTDQIDDVFLAQPGRAIRQRVLVREILSEAKRQASLKQMS